MSATQVDRAAARKKKKEAKRRRTRVLDMYNKGSSQAEMAEALGVDQSTISRDIQVLSGQAAGSIGELFEHRLELECARLISGFDGATKMVWEILDDKSLPPKERVAAVAVLLKCYDARKKFMPTLHSAKDYLRQRQDLIEDMEMRLDAAVKERGWDEPESDAQAAPAKSGNTLEN